MGGRGALQSRGGAETKLRSNKEVHVRLNTISIRSMLFSRFAFCMCSRKNTHGGVTVGSGCFVRSSPCFDAGVGWLCPWSVPSNGGWKVSPHDQERGRGGGRRKNKKNTQQRFKSTCVTADCPVQSSAEDFSQKSACLAGGAVPRRGYY